MRESTRFQQLTGVAVVALATISVPAYADEAERAAVNSDGAANEIVVTGQKRTENVQDVPKAVEVIDQSRLTQAGVGSGPDLAVRGADAPD